MKLFTVVLVIFALGLAIFGFDTGESQPLKIYKPTNDFSWIKTYGAIYYTFNQDQWEKNPDRTFNKDGVQLTKGNFHPVNACHYALYCFDEYKASGNERYKTAFIAQCKYLLDSTQFTSIDDTKIGYHYKITFHDLKNPWYSALAQSEAISVLIRYYSMTKDENVLAQIVKIKNFMLTPVSEGGTLDTTPEGRVWLEEYPKSKQELQVLNGFFISVIALNEYCKLFPTDKETEALYKNCIETAKTNIKFYDTGSWLRYNRGDKRAVANGYMKWQVNEMHHMYELTGDEFFLKQHILWTTYAFNKEYVTQGCKVGSYDWSVPLDKKPDGSFVPRQTTKQRIVVGDIKKGESYPISNKLSVLLDGNVNTNTRFYVNDTIKNKPFISMQIKDSAFSNSISIVLSKDSISEKNIEIFYKTDSVAEWKKIKVKNFEMAANRTYNISFEKINFRFFKIEFNLISNFSLLVGDVNIYKLVQIKSKPEYYFYQTENITIDKDNLTCKAEFADVKDYIIYQRQATKKEDLSTTVWKVDSSYFNKPATTGITRGIGQFLIVYKIKSGKSAMKSVVME